MTEFAHVDPKSVKVLRDQRQRREVTFDDLLDSVRQRGVIQPIIVTRAGELIAGERRLAASIHLGLPTIPVRYKDDLSDIELQIIELEENIKRRDLPWRDATRAMERIHDLYCASDLNWSMDKTAKALSVSNGLVSQYLRVARDLESPKLAQAPGLSAAFNILTRRDERAIDDALSDIADTSRDLFAKAAELPLGCDDEGCPHFGTPHGHVEKLTTAPTPRLLPAERSILKEDFLSWAPSYNGQPYNFIHCDYPYGINVFGGAWSGKQTQDTYGDAPEIYFALIKCLGTNLDRLMSPSAHLMFWFSMDHYSDTLEAFRRFAPSLTFQPHPLLWLKSDNVGILPDHNRGPRRIYETALIASREDRFIVKPVSNAYAAPTDKTHHTSTKPEPVLRHFFQMFVDDNTRLLDPTCGSGSALRAAESLGAPHVMGLEMDEEHCTNARRALNQFRVLKGVTK